MQHPHRTPEALADGLSLPVARHTAVLRSIDALEAPAVSMIDSGGRTHRLWLLGPGAQQDAVLTAVACGPLLVADGNHRVDAASAGDHSNLLALVTGGSALRIGAILAVHEQGRRMPRKSAHFTPKPRSGLLLADLTA